jgi:LPPG:FO 2-phospho-L-lactate transferase
MIVLLTGGTGGAKFIHGLSRIVDPEDLVIVCNTGDDFSLHGLKISPDLDTIMYTLAGLSDVDRGWGIRLDTFCALKQLEKYGAESWFKLGDKDLATHIARTALMGVGQDLSAITEKLGRALGVRAKILPMSNQPVETRVVTPAGEISFQEYFVKQRWQPEVRRVFYKGIRDSRPATGIVESIKAASAIIICPSNPVTSIGPILAVRGVRKALREAPAPVTAVSPIIGNMAISGPAHKLMAAQRLEVSAFGVAHAYRDIVDNFVLDKADQKLSRRIAELGIRFLTTSIRMKSLADKKRLVREVLAFVEK